LIACRAGGLLFGDETLPRPTGAPCATGPDEAVVDVPDPDGTVLRLYWAGASADDDRFMGLAFDDAGEVTFYDTPQLTVPVRT
jgi:hypothetical protein